MKFLRFQAALITAVVLAVGCGDSADVLGPASDPLDAQASASAKKVVQVAPPTGSPATDLAHMQTAIAAAGKGYTIQFQAGTYNIGDNASPLVVLEEKVSLVGHPNGTTIEGGTVIDGGLFAEVPVGFNLVGGQQTIRDITFHSFGTAIIIGVGFPERGGYVVENCTFTESLRPIQAALDAAPPTRITGNAFVNVHQGVQLLGQRYEFSHNTLTVPEPSEVPVYGRPANIGSFLSATFFGRRWDAKDNLIQGNVADRYPDGFILVAFPFSTTHNTHVVDNVVTNAFKYVGFDGGSIVVPEAFGTAAVNENNLIKDNTLDGAEGWGMFVFNSPSNRIIDNTIRNVVGPGGLGIWLLGLNTGNTRILNNHFDGNEVADVQLDSDDNLVVLKESDDTVIDNGENNRIVGAGANQSVATGVLPFAASVSPGSDPLTEAAQRVLHKVPLAEHVLP